MQVSENVVFERSGEVVTFAVDGIDFNLVLPFDAFGYFIPGQPNEDQAKSRKQEKNRRNFAATKASQY